MLATRPIPSLAFGLALLAGTPLPAQITWRLPTRGVAHFDRSQSTKNLEGKGAAAVKVRVKIPPLLFQGELDGKQRYIRTPPADVLDLAMWVAFDLRSSKGKGKFTRTVSTLNGIPTIELKGTATPVDASGQQAIQVVINAPGRKKKGPLRVLRKANRKGPPKTLTGTISITRTLDPDLGCSAFEATFTGAIADPSPKGGNSRFQISDRWTFRKVEANRSPEFKQRVAAAIRAGADAIKRTLPKGDLKSRQKGNHDYTPGELALKLLTLVKAGVDRKDPTLRHGFDLLRRYKITNGYSLATTLMAFEALYAPTDEREMLISGRIEKPLPRQVPEADMRLMTEWTAALLDCHDRSKDPAYVLRFAYEPGNKGYDNSNTQYALLGLYSAHLCGVKISPTVWFANANHWLNDLKDDGGKRVTLTTVSHKAYEKLRDRERKALADGRKPPRRRRTGRTVQGKGWQYVGGRGKSSTPSHRHSLTGSMTTAGIAGVTITAAVLHGQRKGGPLLGKLRSARDAGLAWLHREFSVRVNRNHLNGRYHYYMYGLERALELNQIALVGDRDWYFEGATILLEMQTKPAPGKKNKRGKRRGGRKNKNQSGGTFPGQGSEATCFAVLFLKQAAPPLPAITGR